MTQQQPDRHILVIVPNRAGGLAQIATALGDAGVNIESIDGRAEGDFGVIYLATDDDDAAMRALLKADIRAVASDVVVFHLEDKPGALAGVAQLFAQRDLSVRTIHILHRFEGQAVVAVTTDDDALARDLIGPDALL